MNRTSKTAIALTLALAWAPACDKADADKSGDAKAKTEDKADAKPDAKPEDKPDADVKPADDAAVTEVAADGRVDISVDASGYHPETISAPANSTITLAFKRTTDAGCGQELVIKALDIKKDLPLNEVVEIPVSVPESGELGFACGMDMYKGKVIPKA